MKRRRAPFRLAIGGSLFAAVTAASAADYAVVLSESAARDPAWAAVASALEARHGGPRVPWSGSVTNALPGLRKVLPRRACFVARPDEVTREYVAQVHQLTRALDADPWGDCQWGILTGFDATNALATAQAPGPDRKSVV